MAWLVYEGEKGIDAYFDNNRHLGDKMLVPFKTKGDGYEDFSGVIGEFSRLISEVGVKENLSADDIKNRIKNKVQTNSDEEFEILYKIIQSLYFRENVLIPINTKSLAFIESNITQRQVAGYLYSILIEGSNIKEQYQSMSNMEDTNALEKCLFEVFEDAQKETLITSYHANCYLPYVKNVFLKDISVLLKDTDDYRNNIQRLLAYYYMFYINQLVVKLSLFDKSKRDERQNIFMTLNWERISKVRPGYEYGWKKVKNSLSHIFSHSIVIKLLSYNIDEKHYDYLGLFNRFNGTDEDDSVAQEIRGINDRYEAWIPMDYSRCNHVKPNSTCKVLNEARRLFETIDYQFLNGDRISHYRGFYKQYIEFVQKNFGKRRGTLGYTVGVSENDIIMFSKIILKLYGGKIKLSILFEQFEERGLLFDRDSKRKIVELFEKMNYLEKRSDSGDAQYVKEVL